MRLVSHLWMPFAAIAFVSAEPSFAGNDAPDLTVLHSRGSGPPSEPHPHITSLSEGAWTFGANIIPTARYYAASVAYVRNDTGWVYVFGGDTTGGGVPTRTCSRYNITTNTWSLIAPLPIALRLNAAARLGDRLYSIGGFTTGGTGPIGNVYEYDVIVNTWTQRASLPDAVFFGRAVGYEDSLIYFAGGIDTTGTLRADRIRLEVLLYNRILNSWRTATDMPEAKADGGFALSAGKLYYFGGFDNVSGTTSATLRIGAIDPIDKAQINWTSGLNYASGGIARLHAYSWGLNNIILGGGSNSAFSSTNTFYLYNTTLNTYGMIPSKQVPMTAYQSGAVFPLTRGDAIAKLVIAGGVTTGPALSGTTMIYTDTVSTVGVDTGGDELPSEYFLYQNYPNPFNPNATISFDMPSSGRVTLKVFDIVGREVLNAVDGFLNAGHHRVTVDAGSLSAGVYFYRLTTDQRTLTRRMALVK